MHPNCFIPNNVDPVNRLRAWVICFKFLFKSLERVSVTKVRFMSGVITGLQTHVIVNDRVVPLNDFTQKYIENVLKGIISSLGFNGKEYTVFIDCNELMIFVDDKEVPLRKDFSKLLVRSTIKGVLSPLKGIPFFENIKITITQ